MKLRSYGKINIFLNILGKRKDGYHDIETLIQRIDLFDDIYLKVDKEFEGVYIEIECDNHQIPIDHRNLCYKACMWFIEKYGLKGKIYIKIHKNIPVCSGLGGGTSNGAEIIKALNYIYKLDIPIDVLCRDSIVLGADFPYCILGGSVLCEGIGEKVTKLKSFEDKIILIIKPDFGFSTKDVYNKFNLYNIKYNINKDMIINYLNNDKFYDVCNNISNILEYSDAENMDVIRDMKYRLINSGAINASMSGSGSAVYGVFDNLYLAQRSYDIFKKEFNEVFLTKTINE